MSLFKCGRSFDRTFCCEGGVVNPIIVDMKRRVIALILLPLSLGAAGWTVHAVRETRQQTRRDKKFVAEARRGLSSAQTWITEGVDIQACDIDRRTALWWAASQGRHPVVRELLGAGADPNRADRYGGTPLMAATFSGDFETLTLLIEAGANIEARTEIGSTALRQAAASGHVSSVQVLLKHGATVNARTITGGTPLMKAAEAGHREIVLLLLKHGADPLLEDQNGYSAAGYATLHDHDKLIPLLKKK
jgi:ankyrin repeat protein